MSLIAAAALLVAADGPVMIVSAPEADCTMGYEELVSGEGREALRAIEQCGAAASDDPALQINHGVALARVGEFDAARESFTAAVRHADRFDLETASGDWVDSRVLARKGLAMLDSGKFRGYEALAVR
ncbi:hypothetical protein [Erythrobacter sp. SD-21]|uniref:hypothetical protein n=1 Tax=Erythrobacter sp. SD-21 TaxID=161528 RepID=UPI000153F990|nr:hypothetical protein [Erythrobacter sp. SD-21]EDL48777.1 TPR repeat protein [Erythrobacter sp. SD-21]